MSISLKTIPPNYPQALLEMFYMVPDEETAEEYYYFKDKSISRDSYRLTFLERIKINTYEFSFYNHIKEEDGRYFIIELGLGFKTINERQRIITYGRFIMNDDYKLSLDSCKKIYDLDLTIGYYDNEGVEIIEYDQMAIKRRIAINDILYS